MKTCVVLAALLVAPAAFAQNIVGTAVVDGKIVQLYSDGTWKSGAEAGKKDCVELGSEVRFCPTDQAWQQVRSSTPQVDATFQHDDRHYGQFVVEAIGKADGLTDETIRGAVLGNVQAGSGKPATFLGIVPDQVAGLPAETMSYIVEFQGAEFLFATTMLLTDHLTVQIQTWQVGGLPYTDLHRSLHADFVKSTQIGTAKNE
jgi:hypothetical protein